MRIEELILDGNHRRATYGADLRLQIVPRANDHLRSVISEWPAELTPGFDESFNAITGLNGSGKSNILDAICFVLGITNMTSVSWGVYRH